MRGFNVIWVFSPNGDKVLMCKRQKEPYKGLYNIVGGKIEDGEDGLAAAYRELQEETNITNIELIHVMDSTYFSDEPYRLEIYVGKLNEEVSVYGDEKELVWIDITENFFDMTCFAGHGLLGHVFEVIKKRKLDK